MRAKLFALVLMLVPTLAHGQTPPLTVAATWNGSALLVSGTKATGSPASVLIYVAKGGQPIGPGTGTGDTTVVAAPDGAWHANGISLGTPAPVDGTVYQVEAWISASTHATAWVLIALLRARLP